MAAGKTLVCSASLVCSAYVWRTAKAIFFKIRIVIYELGSHFSQFRLFKEMAVLGHVFIFQLTLTMNITPINITLRTLEKNRIASVLRAMRSS